MACLDTTFLIDLAGGGGKVRCNRAATKLRALIARGDGIVTTRFNVAELFVGVYRSRNPEVETNTVEALLSGVGILEFGHREARLFGQLTAHLQKLGRPTGDMDVLIASTVLTAGHVLVTDNRSHFADIRELVVETY